MINKNTKGRIAVFLACTLLLNALCLFRPPDLQAASSSGMKIARISGETRYETAIQVAQAGWKDAAVAVIASGADANLVDALTIAPLARIMNAPILLTNGSDLTEATAQELLRLNTDTVYVASGLGVITQRVRSQLERIGVRVIALGGQNRYETALNIAKEIDRFRPVSTVLVSTGYSNVDALSASSIAAQNGWPILLSAPEGLPSDSRVFIDNTNITKTYVIGGSGVINDQVLSTLKSPERLGGEDRYATNLEVLKRFENDMDFQSLYVANGLNSHLVDSLVASSYIAGHPLLMVDNIRVTRPALTFLAGHTIATATALGGTAVVSDEILKSLGNTAISGGSSSSSGGSSSGGGSSGKTAFLLKDGEDLIIYNGGNYTPARINAFEETIRTLTIDAAVLNGTVTITDMIIEGDVLIKGGGEHSIKFVNCTFLGKMTVEKKMAKSGAIGVRVYFGRNTIPPWRITVKSKAIIESYATVPTLGRINITTADEVVVMAPAFQVVYDVEVKSPKITVRDDIGLLLVSEDATVTLNGTKALVETLATDGTKLTLAGKGKIYRFLATKPDKIKVRVVRGADIRDVSDNRYETFDFIPAHLVTVDVKNMDYDAPPVIEDGEMVTAFFFPDDDYALPSAVKVQLGSSAVGPEYYNYDRPEAKLEVYRITDHLTITASAKKATDYKITVKATGIKYTLILNDRVVEPGALGKDGQTLEVHLTPENGYRLPVPLNVALTMDGLSISQGTGGGYTYTVRSEEEAVVYIPALTGPVTLTAPGQKIGPLKLTVKATGLTYAATPATPEYGLPLNVLFTSKPGAFPPAEDSVAVDMGGHRLTPDQGGVTGDYRIYRVANDAVEVSIHRVTDSVTITASARSLPTFTVNAPGLEYVATPPQLTVMGQSLALAFTPGEGYDLPESSGVTVTMGVRTLEEGVGYTYIKNNDFAAELRVPNIIDNVVVNVFGVKVPTTKLSIKTPGLDYIAAPRAPVVDRPFSVSFTPQEGYLLPASPAAAFSVKMGSTMLVQGTDYTLVLVNPYTLELLIPNISGDVTISAQGRKLPTIKVNAKGIDYTLAPPVFTDFGQPLTIAFTPQAGYFLPNQNELMVQVGAAFLSLSEFTYTPVGNGAQLMIPAGTIMGDVTVTANGKVKPTYKLTISATGLTYSAVPKAPVEGEPVDIVFTAKSGYYLPKDEIVMVNMGGVNLIPGTDFHLNRSYEIDNDTLSIIIEYVKGDIFISAPGQKVPVATVKAPGLDFEFTQLIAIDDTLRVTFTPKTGYVLPGFVSVQMGGRMQDPSTYQYVINANNTVATLVVENVNDNITVVASGVKIPTYAVTMTGVGINLPSVKTASENQRLSLDFTPKSGYALPADAAIVVSMSGSPLTAVTSGTPGPGQYLLTRVPALNLLNVVIPSVTGNVSVSMPGVKLPTYTIKAAGLTYQATPETPTAPNYKLTVVFTAKAGYELPDPAYLSVVMGSTNLTHTALNPPGPTEFYYNKSGGTATLIIETVTANVTITANGDKIPVYTTKYSGSGFSALFTPATPVHGDPLHALLTLKAGYQMPIPSDVMVQMGSNVLSQGTDYTIDPSLTGNAYIITLTTPLGVTGNVVVTANATKVAIYSTKYSGTGLAAVFTPKSPTHGDPLNVLLTPKKGYVMPAASTDYSVQMGNNTLSPSDYTLVTSAASATLTLPATGVTGNIVVTVNGRKIPTVSVKATGLNYTSTPLQPTTVGAPMTFNFTVKTGYRLPDPSDILITMGGSNLLSGIGYTITPALPTTDMAILVNNVDADLKLTVPGVKVPTYKLTVRPTGLKYTAEKTTLTEGVDKAIIQLRPATGYALPPESELTDYVTATMGGSPVEFAYTYNISDNNVVITIPKNPASFVNGAVAVTAQGYKLPTYRISVTNLTYTVTSSPITGLGQDIEVLLRPKTGYQLPSSDNTPPNQDVFVTEIIGGVGSEIFSPSMLSYDSLANTATLTVPNVNNNIEISAQGRAVPTYNYTFYPSPSPVGLTYRVSSNRPIEHRQFTITFQPRDGYILPSSAMITVTMDGNTLISNSIYSRTTDSENKPIGILEIGDVTGDLEITIAGQPIASYTTDLSHLTGTPTPIVDETSPLVVTLQPRSGYTLPASVTVTSNNTPLPGTAYSYDSATGAVTIPGFADILVYPATTLIRIIASGVPIP
ncbi:MAG: cell wall-binding repeat-containing protein [Gracilibacteraceae bacterium]|jgi:putative cell wall-binding protein|nr:cell wall-binding repeat-containing protein [Gracilibacteraceae bacterium]